MSNKKIKLFESRIKWIQDNPEISDREKAERIELWQGMIDEVKTEVEEKNKLIKTQLQ